MQNSTHQFTNQISRAFSLRIIRHCFSLCLFFLFTNVLYAQQNPQVPDLDSLKKQVSENRQGKGKGLFRVSLSTIENVILSHMKTPNLEQEFGSWETYGGLNNVELEYDDKTQDHTLPLFVINYESRTNNHYYKFKIEIERKMNNSIKYFELTTILNGMQLAEFKKSLAKNNYLLNENLTQIFHKLTYQSRSKALMISIKENSDNSYSIGIRKS